MTAANSSHCSQFVIPAQAGIQTQGGVWRGIIGWFFAEYVPAAVALKSTAACSRRLDFVPVQADQSAPVFARRIVDKYGWSGLYFGYTLERARMATKIQKWGNSQGLRIPRAILDEAHISVGDEVDVSTRDGVIIVQPTKRIRGRRKLEDLLARIPKNYRAKEQDWGGPRGKEAW